MQLSVTNLDEFNAEISRYAAVRGKTFEYASLRAVKNWMYNAREIVKKNHPQETTKILIENLYGEVRLISFLLRKIAEGSIKRGQINEFKKGKRGKFYAAKDAQKIARKLINTRRSRSKFTDAFSFVAQKWISEKIKSVKSVTGLGNVTFTGKNKYLTNNSSISSSKNISLVEVDILYAFKSTTTSAGKSSSSSSLAFNKMYQDALAQALPIAIKDVKDYTDKELARLK